MMRDQTVMEKLIRQISRLEREIEILKADKPLVPVWSLTSITLTGNQNNFDVGDYAIVFLNGAGPFTITGFTGGVLGRVLILLWSGSSTLTLSHLSASSDLNNRIVVMGAAARVMNNFTSGNGTVVGLFWGGTFWDEMWHSTP